MIATAEATRTRRLFFKKSRFILSLKECSVGCVAAVLSKTGRAKWHDFGRCQKKINGPCWKQRLAQFGVELEVALPIVGQLLLNDMVTLLHNVGSVARLGQFRFHLLELGLGQEKAIRRFWPVSIAPLLPST
jgi:hypothetical protein